LQDEVIVQSDFNLQSEFGEKTPSQQRVTLLAEQMQYGTRLWAKIQIRYRRGIKIILKRRDVTEIFPSAGGIAY